MTIEYTTFTDMPTHITQSNYPTIETVTITHWNCFPTWVYSPYIVAVWRVKQR